MPSSSKSIASFLQRTPLPVQGAPKLAPKPVKGKRATLPLDDRLALAELSEALTGGVRDKLDGIEKQLRRIADALELRPIARQEGDDFATPGTRYGRIPF